MSSDEKKVRLATHMIEQVVRLAMDAGRNLVEGNIDEALNISGMCIAQIFAFEAMRQKTNGAAVVHQWNQLWNDAMRNRLKRGSPYTAALHRSRN